MNYCCRVDNKIHYFDSEADAVDYAYESLKLGNDVNFASRKRMVDCCPNVEISEITMAEDIEMLGKLLMGGNVENLCMNFDDNGNLKGIEGD